MHGASFQHGQQLLAWKANKMKKLILIFSLIFLLAFGPLLLSTIPFFTRVAGIITQNAVSRGFLANDPRVLKTVGNVVYLIGKQAVTGKIPGSKTNLLTVISASSTILGIQAIAGLSVDSSGNAKIEGPGSNINDGDQLFTNGRFTTNLANAYTELKKTEMNCEAAHPNCSFELSPELTIVRDQYNSITSVFIYYEVYDYGNAQQLITNGNLTLYSSGTAATSYDCPSFNDDGCIIPSPDYQTPIDFYTQLAPYQKEIEIDPAFLSDFINLKWGEAAQEDNFGGIPPSAENPITPTKIRDDYNENGPLTLDSIAKPLDVIPDQNGNPLLDATYDPSAAGEDTTTTPNADKEALNLGEDPNIGSPTIENISAGSILSPILNLLPGFKNFQLIEPQNASCEPIHIDVWFADVSTQSHCDLFEFISPALQVVMTIFWTGLGIFIVLGA